MREQIANGCVHFTGIQHDKCKAGVDYESFRPARIPCLRSFCKGESTCSQRRFPTEAEVDAEVREIDEALARVGDGYSPCCDAKLDDRRVDGVGAAYCSKCRQLVVRACNPRGSEV